MNVTPGVKQDWEAIYAPLYTALTTVWQGHLREAPTPEEFQLRVVGDFYISIVNLFLANGFDGTPSELKKEVGDFIQNLARCVAADRFDTYNLISVIKPGA